VPQGQVEDEIRITDTKKVVILGGGPNRIGQGIEFDYCCCHAAFAADELGFESVMINSNPETVSTDYDTSDLLFFEPLTLEDVLNVVERLNGSALPQGRGIKHYRAVRAPITESHSQRVLGELQRLGYDRAAVFNMSEATRECDAEGNSIDFEHHYHVLTADGRLWNARFATGPRSVSFRLEPLEDSGLDGSECENDTEVRAVLDDARSGLGIIPGHVLGLIVQFGGQTPLNLAHGLVKAGAPIMGTSVDSIDIAEDRKRFDALLERLKISRPQSGIARSLDEAIVIANRIGYPVLVRPSYVLGGRGMEVCPDERALRHYVTNALHIAGVDDAPVLIDRFLDAATEVDVDVVADFEPLSVGSDSRPPRGQALICGVMEHIEQAGIHSGDSSCTVPPWSLPRPIELRIREICLQLAQALRVNGLMNVQLAVKDGEVFILEVNPRASRTAPFVSKATHIPWPAIAAKVMMGKSLTQVGARESDDRSAFAVKESVFPFGKFPGVDVVLGPEMRSTGEVMGIDRSFPVAFAKSQMGAGQFLPTSGGVFLSVRESDRPAIVEPARSLLAMGFTVYATEGTADHLEGHGVRPKVLQKIAAGARPNVLDLMANAQIALIINTPTRTGWQTDEGRIRSTAVRLGIPMITTATGAIASVKAIEALRAGDWDVAAMQDYRSGEHAAGAERTGEVKVVPARAGARA
jgi:carbamoylphosphate synthase large subunit